VLPAPRQQTAFILGLGHETHFVMEDLLLLAVVPSDGDAGLIPFDDRACIFAIAAPNHVGAHKQLSRFAHKTQEVRWDC